jgi:hypothetical protein
MTKEVSPFNEPAMTEKDSLAFSIITLFIEGRFPRLRRG